MAGATTIAARATVNDALESLFQVPVPGLDVASLVARRDLLDEAERQGVLAQLVERAGSEPLLRGIVHEAKQRLRSQALHMAWSQQATRHVLWTFGEAGIRTLVFKGEALAASLYPTGASRPRFDTDILVEAVHFELAHSLLRSLAYRRLQVVSRQVHRQCTLALERGSMLHVVDLHYSIQTPVAVAGLTTLDELWRDSIALPALGPSGRGPSLVWSLVIACVHRVAHHNSSVRLIWLHDIRLIADRLNDSEWTAFWSLANDRGVSRICRDGLQEAARRAAPDGALWMRHAPPCAGRNDEASATLLNRRATPAGLLVSDFRHSRGLSQKVRASLRHVLPDLRHAREPLSLKTAWSMASDCVSGATTLGKRVFLNH